MLPEYRALEPSLMAIAPRPDLVFVRGRGSWLFDDAGRRYLDWVQGWAVNVLGHAPPAVAEAIARQAATLLNPSPAFHNAPALRLAGLLTAHCGLHRVFFASSGAEANEGAIKLARKWGRLHRGGAHEIVTFDGAFHGRTLATMSASGKPGWDTMYAPQVPGFPKARLNDLESVRRAVGERTVAVMLEPIQGEAGVVPADGGFLRELRALCDARGLLLVLDEVQTGSGRTGRAFAHQHHGVAPDVMTLGKGLGGGVPLAALLATERVACFEPGEQGGTYCGNPLACAAGVATMEIVLDEGFLERVRGAGARLRAGLEATSRALGLGEVRGEGLLLALELGAEIAPEVVVAAREAGLLLNAPRAAVLRFMPALDSTDDEIDAGLAVLQRVLREVGGARADARSR